MNFMFIMYTYVTVKATKSGKYQALLVNTSLYQSELVKAQSILLNSSISGFFEIISANARFTDSFL